MKLETRRYCSAQFVTRLMGRLNIAEVVLTTLAAIYCGTNASAEEVSGRVLSPQQIQSSTSAIDGEAIIANAKTTKDWLSYGLDYAESRYSKLNQINTESVKSLGLKWTYNLESQRGVEATPLIVDGIMYVSASWSVVHAIDVRTGKRIWTYDPEVRRQVRKLGDGLSYQVIRASPTKMSRWKRRRRLGIRPEGTGSMAGAVRRGTRWRTIRI